MVFRNDQGDVNCTNCGVFIGKRKHAIPFRNQLYCTVKCVNEHVAEASGMFLQTMEVVHGKTAMR